MLFLLLVVLNLAAYACDPDSILISLPPVSSKQEVTDQGQTVSVYEYNESLAEEPEIVKLSFQYVARGFRTRSKMDMHIGYGGQLILLLASPTYQVPLATVLKRLCPSLEALSLQSADPIWLNSSQVMYVFPTLQLRLSCNRK